MRGCSELANALRGERVALQVSSRRAMPLNKGPCVESEQTFQEHASRRGTPTAQVRLIRLDAPGAGRTALHFIGGGLGMTDSRIGLGRNGAGGTATLEDTYERVATRGHDDRAHTGPIEDAPTRELVGRIVNNFSGLVDKQVQLAKLEVKENLGEAAGDIKSAAIGAGIALAAGLLLTIWAWTGVIWLFNWVGAMFGAPFVGWIVGFVV